MSNIKQAEVWLVRLNPTVGAEMRKERPVVVLNADTVGTLPIKLVAPITGWQDSFEHRFWLVRLQATPQNGLSKSSAADVLQMRGLDESRFMKKLGVLEDEAMDDIRDAVALLMAARK
jgi:mRNA interferase MazF